MINLTLFQLQLIKLTSMSARSSLHLYLIKSIMQSRIDRKLSTLLDKCSIKGCVASFPDPLMTVWSEVPRWTGIQQAMSWSSITCSVRCIITTGRSTCRREMKDLSRRKYKHLVEYIVSIQVLHAAILHFSQFSMPLTWTYSDWPGAVLVNAPWNIPNISSSALCESILSFSLSYSRSLSVIL